MSWDNRVSQKPISFIILFRCYVRNLSDIEENMEMIEKYIKLGVIKKFKH